MSRAADRAYVARTVHTAIVKAYLANMRAHAKVAGSCTKYFAGHVIHCYLTAGHHIRWSVDAKSRSGIDTMAFMLDLAGVN